jgi:DNA-binding transcriptional ArsR family regulator
MLQEREMCVSDIVESFNTSQPTVSHHLIMLKNVGLVRSRREGKLVFYSINQENVDECCGMIVAKFGCREP